MKTLSTLMLVVLVLVAGLSLSIVFQTYFRMHPPIVRTAVAIFFIVFGARMLARAWSPETLLEGAGGSTLMTDERFSPGLWSDRLKYEVILGRSEVDLTRLPRPTKDTTLEINVVFGACELLLPADWPFEVEGSAAFAELRMPNQSLTAFGTTTYRPPESRERAILHVKVNTVFGSCRVRNEQMTSAKST